MDICSDALTLLCHMDLCSTKSCVVLLDDCLGISKVAADEFLAGPHQMEHLALYRLEGQICEGSYSGRVEHWISFDATLPDNCTEAS